MDVEDAVMEGSGTVGCSFFMGLRVIAKDVEGVAEEAVVGFGRAGCGGEGSLGRTNWTISARALDCTRPSRPRRAWSLQWRHLGTVAHRRYDLKKASRAGRRGP